MSPGSIAYPIPECVNAFIARLATLPIGEWLDVGRSLATDREHLAARSAARAVLDTTIANQGLGVTAWYVRDAVETVVCLASSVARPWTPAERRRLGEIHQDAEGTALALLAREYLPVKDFNVLCAPFAAYVSRIDGDACSRDPIDAQRQLVHLG